MATSFPKLPGYVPLQDPTIVNHKKVSHIALEKQINPKNKPVPLYPLPRKGEPELPPDKDPKSLSFSQSIFKNHFGKEIMVQFEPVFAQLDNQVLRFYGYFQEAVTESPLENFKVHKLILLYYLVDQTLQIIEPKIENSGTPQGAFLKRQQVLRADNSGLPIVPQDIIIGKELVVYSKHIKIVDCDQYTREFYENVGIQQAQPILVQKDSFAKSLIKHQPVKDTYMKDFLEHSLGGGRIPSQKQFLDNDRKVLRLYGFYDEGYPCILHYFLADDTIEIREIHFTNDGRDPFPLFLKRQKFPKVQVSLSQPGQFPKIESYYKEADFFADQPFRSFSHEFVFTGVDEFTANYYKQKYNRDFVIGRLEPPKPKATLPIKVPPYNGYGDEADSLGYVYRLIPKPPKKDFFKFVDNDKNLLRFTARLNTLNIEDADRMFIIIFYLADDTISVFEPQQRNSGIVEGKFLERRKYKSNLGFTEFLTLRDFEVGKNIVINGFNFQILSCDDYTEKYLEQYIK